MSKQVGVSAFAVVSTALLLAGCGDSYPIPATGAKPSAVAPPAVVATQKCNLDSVNGAAVGASPLTRDKPVLFAGWAASGDGKTVPATVEILLEGAHQHAIWGPTGVSRPDVTSANQAPALAQSGYAIEASVASIPAGTYSVTLRYTAGETAWRCVTGRLLSIQ